MEQMKNSIVPAKKVIVLGDLHHGFFRVKGDSGKIFLKIFFCGVDNGRVLILPVLKDGSVCKTTAYIDSAKEIEVIDQTELGIGRIYYSEPGLTLTS